MKSTHVTLLCVLAFLPVISEISAGSPNLPKGLNFGRPSEPSALDSGETVKPKPKDERPKLHMANPFFLPYAGELQITIQASTIQSRVRSDAPSQTFFGLPMAAGYSESTGGSYAATVGFRYGIFDRFIVGIATDYYASETPKTTRVGTTSSSFISLSAPSGFTGPEFSAYGRFAGTRPGEVYLDAGLALRPGIGSSDKNDVSVGRPSGTFTLASGINWGILTFGLAAGLYYAPGNSAPGYGSVGAAAIASGLAVGQVEWRYAYLRGSFGYARYVDSLNSKDSVNRFAYLSYGLAAGVKFTEATLLDVGWTFTPEIRGEEYMTGYASAFRQTNTVGPSHRVVLAFSLKL